MSQNISKKVCDVKRTLPFWECQARFWVLPEDGLDPRLPWDALQFLLKSLRSPLGYVYNHVKYPWNISWVVTQNTHKVSLGSGHQARHLFSTCRFHTRLEETVDATRFMVLPVKTMSLFLSIKVGISNQWGNNLLINKVDCVPTESHAGNSVGKKNWTAYPALKNPVKQTKQRNGKWPLSCMS